MRSIDDEVPPADPDPVHTHKNRHETVEGSTSQSSVKIGSWILDLESKSSLESQDPGPGKFRLHIAFYTLFTFYLLYFRATLRVGVK